MISVIVAAIASYAFGAVWYMSLAKPWMAAAGLSEEDVNRSNPVPYILSFVAAILVAGMMRHVFVMSEISTAWVGLKSGLGLGLFVATPWIMTNYGFSQRPFALTIIDGGYATIGCTIIGIVLGWWGVGAPMPA